MMYVIMRLMSSSTNDWSKTHANLYSKNSLYKKLACEQYASNCVNCANRPCIFINYRLIDKHATRYIKATNQQVDSSVTVSARDSLWQVL